jgi:hypothetical protein
VVPQEPGDRSPAHHERAAFRRIAQLGAGAALPARRLGADVLQLRPDFLFALIGIGAKNVMVGDAKWKRLLPSAPSLGLKAADLYQLTAYMIRHEINKGILFFPSVGQEKPLLRRFSLADSRSTVTVITVDIVGLVARDKERRNNALQELKTMVHEVAMTADSAT